MTDTPPNQGARLAIAVVIPYYRGEQFIDLCIDSLLSGTCVPDAIYIVDNDPPGIPATSPLRKNQAIHVIRTRPAIGFGRASNAGVQTALRDGYSIFIVLNQDTIVDKKCLESLTHTYDPALSPCVISATLKPFDRDEISKHFRANILSQIPDFGLHEKQGRLEPVYALKFVFASCILIDKAVVTDVGLFDPVFHMYGEDNDLSNRVLIAGGHLLLCPIAYVHHKHSFENAAGKQRLEIERDRIFSIAVLNVRYKGWSISRMILRSVWQCLRNLFAAPSGIPARYAWYHIRSIPVYLMRWRVIRSFQPDHVLARIRKALNRDLVA